MGSRGERATSAAKRRHKLPAAERAQRLERNRLEEIFDQILETPANGIGGLAVILALIQVERDFLQEPATCLMDSASATMTKLIGGSASRAVVKRGL